jgi:hypothetical protein
MATRTKPAPAPKTAPAANTGPAAKSAASATATDGPAPQSGLPAGFVSPFKRVEMRPNIRVDDGLACISMLANQPLDDVMKMAFKHGLATHGPSWCYATCLKGVLREYGLNADEKECPTIDALPDVAMITTFFDPATLYGRWALWHHVRAKGKTKSFRYVIDPAYWIEPSRQIVTTDIHQLITPKHPIYYLEITPMTAAKGRGK